MTTQPTVSEIEEAPKQSDVRLPGGRYVDQDDRAAHVAARAAVLEQSPIAKLLSIHVHGAFEWHVERNGVRYSVRFEPAFEVGQIRESIEWIVTPQPEGAWKVERA